MKRETKVFAAGVVITLALLGLAVYIVGGWGWLS